eukprot:GHVN01058140.1.p1 GENE.GHVN01058140.1~~GHVN01058140.1.p1  ORF type:complete len:434 (-),score=60.72 GHVN01058140.1:410-1615(-)
MDKTAEEAYRPFRSIEQSFIPFRDATYGVCTYQLSILNCLRGLEYGIRLGWFSYKTFDCDEYELHGRVENGDLNWIIPHRFAAFSGPSSCNVDEEGFAALTPEDYISLFKKLAIRLIIRLNKKQYDRQRFLDHNVNHLDLYFLDGSCPSREIINKFLDVTEREIAKGKSAVAVHCKAGLGRTGTLIGCYAIKHFRFPAAAWIGWNRICRPGSVLGPQQHYLCEIQNDLLQMGASKAVPRPLTRQGRDAAETGAGSSPLPMSGPQVAADGGGRGRLVRLKKDVEGGAAVENELIERFQKSLTFEERRVADKGEAGQGERLVLMKRSHLLQVSRGGDTRTSTNAASNGDTSSEGNGKSGNGPNVKPEASPSHKESGPGGKDNGVPGPKAEDAKDKESRKGKQN